MLKPLSFQSSKQQQEEKLPPPHTCEACGTIVAIGHFAINFIAVVGSPGHPELAPVQCEHTEHWACSLPCWSRVAHACIDEHMVELLKRQHEGVGIG